jgi:TonB family protein
MIKSDESRRGEGINQTCYGMIKCGAFASGVYAKTLGSEGLVLVTFTVDRQGIRDPRVVWSSGLLLLDDNALRTVSQAGPFPPRPPDLIGDRFSFTVPLRYLSHEQN